MADTTNFTASLDRGLLKRAKVIAAQQDTSVNALLNAQLRSLVETYENAERSQNDNYPTLLAFSLGNLDSTEALQRLGLDSEEDLFLLMMRANLPMPRLDEEATAEMVDALRRLVRK